MSHSRPPSPADVQKEREASKHRLLSVWTSLADRYTRRLDQDDIVDIRTGEIMIDRGFIRKSRTLNFGAISAPDAGDAIADEGTDEEEENEYDLDELDAFADTTDEDVIEMGLRIKPVPPMTALNSADAEDLRAFLEEERKRKDLYGSDVEVEEDEDADQNREPEVVEREIVNLVSEDELDNWDIDESSVIVPKQEDSDIPSSTSDFRTPSITRSIPYVLLPPLKSTSPQVKSGQHETLQKSPRKRKRVSSDSDHLPCHDQPVYKIPDNKVVNTKSPRRSSSRSLKPQPSPKLSAFGSGSESGNSSDSEQEYNREPSLPHYSNFQFPYNYPYHHHHQSYLLSPHQKQQRHPPPPPEMFAPPIPDPRAQFIITQAMHQLSALVGTPWTLPHDPSYIPHTPSRRHQSKRANSVFNTPYHPHPYPYSYDPNLSIATLPPDSSPEPISSPEKLSSHGARKSSMARARNRSRERQVSFKFDRGSDRVDVYNRVEEVYSSPSKPPSRREVVMEYKSTTRTSKGKGKAKMSDSESMESPSNCGSGRDDDGRKSYLRGQTPGPQIGLPKGMNKRGHDSKRRLKGSLDVAA